MKDWREPERGDKVRMTGHCISEDRNFDFLCLEGEVVTFYGPTRSGYDTLIGVNVHEFRQALLNSMDEPRTEKQVDEILQEAARWWDKETNAYLIYRGLFPIEMAWRYEFELLPPAPAQAESAEESAKVTANEITKKLLCCMMTEGDEQEPWVGEWKHEVTMLIANTGKGDFDFAVMETATTLKYLVDTATEVMQEAVSDVTEQLLSLAVKKAASDIDWLYIARELARAAEVEEPVDEDQIHQRYGGISEDLPE